MKKGSKRSNAQIHVLNGPNLNMLGYREPEIYGTDTLKDLEKKLLTFNKSQKSPHALKFFQTNYEGEMIEYVQTLFFGPMDQDRLAGVILNPGGWTHTSVALRDAVVTLKPTPLVEVHLSNPMEREEFRHFSFFEDIADHRIVGMGQQSYIEALRWILSESHKERLDVH